MTEIDPQAPVKRPEFRNINAFKDLPSYRLPPAGWVSILHRISGAIMFMLLPFVIWMFDTSVSSEISFLKFKSPLALFLINKKLPYYDTSHIKFLACLSAYLHPQINKININNKTRGECHHGKNKPKQKSKDVPRSR